MKCIEKIFVLALLPSLFYLASSASAQMSESDGIDFFETKIRPVLIRECYGCHSDQTGQAKGGLKLDTKQGLLLGGDSGPSLVPGSLEDSPLWSAINYEDYAMPPSKPLPTSVIEDFRIWIQSGAPDPRAPAPDIAIAATVSDADIKRGQREFWAFRPPVLAPPSLSEEQEWTRGPVDEYVLAELEQNQLQPAVDADPYTLLRRLCFDLTGLPPTPAQVQKFVEDWQADADSALAREVDRLLASPGFGERWGRHWLDLARFAESSGKELNSTFPHAWRYRDYVIDSFNADKPYDRFVQEQVAGDLLPVKTDRQWSENLVATGFLAMGPKTLTERNPRQFRADLIDEQIDVSTRVVLGISVACARCHDHKFDPIPQRDYYALAGIFGNTDTYYGTLDTRQNRRSSDLILLPTPQQLSFEKPLSPTELDVLREQLAQTREDYREASQLRRQARRGESKVGQQAQQAIRQLGALSNRMAALQSLIDSHDSDGQPKTYCMGVQPVDQPGDANLLIRGEVDQPVGKVPRGFVQVIGGKQKSIRKTSSGRLEFARWMTDASNPLTARVMVNRIWQHLLGKGIVGSTENFGATGLPPTHPALLDYLAIQLMDNDWSIKSIIREVATSRTYRMSSQFDAASFEKDPDNQWLWRASPRRLEAEAIRDAMLSLSGTLDKKRPEASEVAKAGTTIVRNGQMRSVRNNLRIRSLPDLDSGLPGRRGRDTKRRRRDRLANRTAVPSSDPLASYRSVYLPVVRDSIPRALDVFDFAESSMVIGRREASNTPDQGLYFLNNPRVLQLSRGFARTLLDHSADRQQQVQRAFLLAYGRPATAEESTASLAYLNQVTELDSELLEPLTYLCQSIMAAAEFRIVN